MVWHGYKEKIVQEPCAVVAGSSIRGAAARPFALGTLPAPGTPTTVFGLWFRPSISLYSFFLFPSLPNVV